jgi:hypothetical protein
MTKAVWSGVVAIALVLLVLFSTNVFAQTTTTATVTATAAVAAKARLEITGAVAFADADPETTTEISASPLDVVVKARTGPAQNVTLTVVANGDLLSGTQAIPIANLTWAATGTNFVPGTASTAAQSVGSWTGSGTRTGTQTYRLANSWAYATGNYTVILTYTLTAP